MGSIFSSAAASRDLNEPATLPEEQDLKLPPPISRTPIFVMMPLDWMLDAATLRDPTVLDERLNALKGCGIRGVMADVWWGLCEPKPKEYEFGALIALCERLSILDMKLQATLSFHRCGGNVGDAVTINLPDWVLEPALSGKLMYCSSAGVVAEECLSLAADTKQCLGGRTPLDCYRDFVAALVSACGKHVGNTIVELQVGMGPCGELRYPSYMLYNGWEYPGTGLIMASDPGMLSMLKEATDLIEPPPGFPEDQNGLPDDAMAFCVNPSCIKLAQDSGKLLLTYTGGKLNLSYGLAARGALTEAASDKVVERFKMGNAKVFLEWYSRVLIEHGRAVLKSAVAGLTEALAGQTMAGKLDLSIKVSGIHWHSMHPSRAAEACAGYNCCTTPAADAYSAIAQMLSEVSKEAKLPVAFNFTCLEMNNWSNGMPKSFSAPEDLIAQVRRACVACDVPLSGENALEFDVASGGWAFEQMKKQLRAWSSGRDAMHALTILRLNEAFVRPSSLKQLRKFVSET